MYSIAFVFISSLSLYGMMILRYYPTVLPFQPVKFAVLVLLSVAALLCHIRRKRQLSCSCYPVFVLTGNNGRSPRIAYLDWLRVIAVVFVILVHIITPIYAEMTPHSSEWLSLALPGVLLHSCNLIFLMLSGALLLNGKEQPVPVFYLRRFSRILIPALLYYLFYRFSQPGLSVFLLRNLPGIFADLVNRAATVPPHYWIIYIIVAFYLAAPFFRIMVQHMDDNTLRAMMTVILLINGLYAYLPLFGMSLPFGCFLLGFESLFFFGYFFTRPFTDRYYKPVMFCGLLSLLLSAVILRTSDNYELLLYNNTPTMILISCALWMFVKRHTSAPGERPLPAVFQFISHYSFSILLIHWYILHDVVETRLQIYAENWPLFVGIPVTAIITLALCGLFAFIFDNTILICAETVVEIFYATCITKYAK